MDPKTGENRIKSQALRMRLINRLLGVFPPRVRLVSHMKPADDNPTATDPTSPAPTNEAPMQTVRTVIVSAIAACLLCLPAAAQAPNTPEARLKALTITLPPDAAPAGNFVNSVQTGKLLFLAGNTGGAAWAGKGKV